MILAIKPLSSVMSVPPAAAVAEQQVSRWVEEDVTLKYHRLHTPKFEEPATSSSSSASRPSPPTLNETVQEHRVTALDLSEENIVVGTEDGHVHIVNHSSGEILKSFRPHDRAVNDVSVDNAGTTIVSCSDSGTVTLHYMGMEGEKENIVHINEPVKCVCVEDDSTAKRDRSFVVGTSSGQLLYYSQVWFTKKQLILFSGDDSAVSVISWRGNVIAWADACQVRLLDIASKTAICCLSSPAGVSKVNPYPCKLFWESNSNLYIGWADNFRNLELLTQSTAEGDSNAAVIGVKQTVNARTVADWQADVIISGLSSFDSNHVIILGYVPPDIRNYEGTNDEDECEDSQLDQPEIQILKKDNGSAVVCDVIPVHGNKLRGPWSYHLASNYGNFNRRNNLHRWELENYRSTRGGTKGMCPTCYLTSGEDFIVVRVRDINDRVHSALETGDIKKAVCLAFSDRTSLRQYQLHDLMTLYLEDLLDNGRPDLAAEECNALIGRDAILWERWIHAFIVRKELPHIAPYIPIKSPRLPSSVYEVVLESFLQNDTKEFLETVRKWSILEPHIFDHDRLLLRLQATHGSADRFCLEAEAELYMLAKEYHSAIAAYLEIEGDNCKPSTAKSKNGNVGKEGSESYKKRDFSHIFDLIEKEDLFDHVKDKLSNMFRLSREHTEQFLLRNIEKLTIKTVVQQLKKIDRRSLCWYLHMIFTNCFDVYNTEEYASYHRMQISLYAEEAALSNAAKRGNVDNKENAERNNIYHTQQEEIKNGFDLITGGDTQVIEDDFIAFLKHSNYVPFDEALRECESRNPPLYKEMVYILARQGQPKKALGLLLREDGNAIDAIRFVESHDRDLWPLLVEYSMSHSRFLAQLLDYLGICNIDPYLIVSRIPAKLYIPNVQKKMKQIVGQYDFQVFLNDVCNDILENDALTLLRNLNHNQRKAIKVYPQQMRCRICSRPLYLSHGPIPNDSMTLKGFQRLKSELYKVWGNCPSVCGENGPSDSDVLVFSNVASFHSFCYQEIYGDAIKQDSKEEDEERDVDSVGGGYDNISPNQRDSVGIGRESEQDNNGNGNIYYDDDSSSDVHNSVRNSVGRSSYQSTSRESIGSISNAGGNGNSNYRNSSSSITY